MTKNANSVSVGWLLAVAIAGLPGCSPEVIIGSLDTTGAGSPGSGSPGSGTRACGSTATLTEGIPESRAIAYANDAVYVSSGLYGPTSDILRVTVSGGAPTLFAHAVPLVAPTGLAADAANVYTASDSGGLRKLPVNGATPTVLYEPNGADVPRSIALGGGYVYWGSGDGSIKRLPVDGGVPAVVSPAVTGTDVFAMAVDDANVYWIEANPSTMVLRKAPLAGGASTLLFTGTSALMRIAVSGAYVYVTQQGQSLTPDGNGKPIGEGAVIKLRIDESEPPVEIASNQPFAIGIAADASGVYWGGGTEFENWGAPVNRLPAGGNQAVALASLNVTYEMTQCGAGICWMDVATGNLMRYPECAP